MALPSDLGWDTAKNQTFIADFFCCFFSSWVIFQPVWFPDVLDGAAAQMCASRLCWGWKNKAVGLSSWGQGGTMTSSFRAAAAC